MDGRQNHFRNVAGRPVRLASNALSQSAANSNIRRYITLASKALLLSVTQSSTTLRVAFSHWSRDRASRVSRFITRNRRVKEMDGVNMRSQEEQEQLTRPYDCAGGVVVKPATQLR